ncbi:MAG: hypothetical protein MR911_05585 [Spirochaetia bacterium]|nr:hypothetical protein [Spirochaetia bacterium]
MSDSTDTTKELDNYGVWVKTPPKDASQTSEGSDFQLDTDLPDFSDLDMNTSASATDASAEPSISEDFNFDSLPEDSVVNETPVSVTEEPDFSDITDSGTSEEDSVKSDFTDDVTSFEEVSFDSNEISSESSEELSIDDFMSDSSESSGGEEEISLDDFMDGDFTDPNPGATPAPSPVSSMEDGEISLDDFFDDDTTISKEKEDDVANDEALDIDLSFTDEEVPTVEESEIIDETPAEDENSTENTEFSETTEFDDMFSSLGESEAKTASEETEISMDEFGISDSAPTESNSGSSSEEIDLSDFGIDSDAEETAVHQDVQAAKKNLVVDYDLSISDEDETKEMQISSTVPEKSESAVTVPENSSIVSNSILEQIMSELSGLKNEINNLKTDFETLKNCKVAEHTSGITETEVPEVNEEAAVEIPESIEETPEAFADIPESIEETPEALADIPEIIEETPEAFADIPETIEESPEVNEEAAVEIPESIEETPEAFADIPETIEETPEAFADIPETIEETPEAFADIPESIEETPVEITENDTSSPDSMEEIQIPVPEKNEDSSNGFFGTDDEDETIALSGDELNNIMITADFAETEETVENNEAVYDADTETESVTEPASESEKTEESPFDFPITDNLETESAGTSDSFELPSEESEETVSEDFSEIDTSFDNLESPEEDIVIDETISEPVLEDISINDSAEEPSTDDITLPEESELNDASIEIKSDETEPTDENNSAIDTTFTDDNPFGAINETAMNIPVEESDSGLSIEENSENLAEPDFDSLENQEIETEITIPKVDEISENENPSAPEDDILVESSNDDFMDSVAESEMVITQSEATEPACENIDVEENIDVVEEIPDTVDISSEIETTELSAEEVSNVEPFNDSIDNFDSMLDSEKDISEQLSDENVDYLKSDENVIESDMENMSSAINESETLSESMISNIDATMEDPFPPIESVIDHDERVEKQEAPSDTLISIDLKNDIKSVLLYMDQLLENLPEEKIMEFAKSEQFGTYKRLFNELGLS